MRKALFAARPVNNTCGSTLVQINFELTLDQLITYEVVSSASHWHNRVLTTATRFNISLAHSEVINYLHVILFSHASFKAF